MGRRVKDSAGCSSSRLEDVSGRHQDGELVEQFTACDKHSIQGSKVAHDVTLGLSRVFSVLHSLDSTAEFSNVALKFKAEASMVE